MAQLTKMPGGKNQIKKRKNAIKKYLGNNKKNKGKVNNGKTYLHYDSNRLPKFIKQELKNAA
jgi:hypothetical protein